MDTLNRITALWLRKVELAQKHREQNFDLDGDRAAKFYGESHKFLFMENSKEAEHYGFPADGFRPFYKATINQTANWVRLMLPYIHQRVPNRVVSPRRPPLPPELMGIPPGMPIPQRPIELQDSLRSKLMGWVLNYTPEEYGLESETKQSVIEALIRGRGVVWHELVDTPNGTLVGSFHDSVKNLVIDPDAERHIRHASWAARLRRRPIWEVAEEFRVPVKELRGVYKSQNEKARELNGLSNIDVAPEKSRDVIEYWEIYSRCGIGSRFHDAGPDMEAISDDLQNVFLCVADGLDFPLNLPRDLIQPGPGQITADEVKDRLSWPIPFWANYTKPFPFTPLDFYPDGLWPMVPLAPSLPIQAWMDYAYAFILGRVQATCRDIYVVDDCEDEIEEAIVRGKDLVVIRRKNRGNISTGEAVQVIKSPNLNTDVFQALALAQSEWERQTGLTELAYGMTQRQMRSAAEANAKQQNMNIRPDDMAQSVENFGAEIARSEALAIRLYVGPDVVAPMFGEQFAPEGTPEMPAPIVGPMTQAWMQLVMTQDPHVAAADLAYTVEAGSGRKKNLSTKLSNIQEAMQFLFAPAMQHYQQTGDPRLVNGLLRQWGEASEQDVEQMLFSPPHPQPPMPPPGGDPSQQGGPPQGMPPQMPPGMDPQMMQMMMAQGGM